MSRRRTSRSMRANVLLLSNEGDSLPCDPNTVRQWFREYETNFFMSSIRFAQNALYVLRNPESAERHGTASSNVYYLERESYAYAIMLEFAEFLGIDRLIDPGRLAQAQRRADKLREIVAGLNEQIIRKTSLSNVKWGSASYSEETKAYFARLADIEQDVQALLPRIG